MNDYKKLLLGASIAAGAIGAGSIAIGKFAMDVALNRTMPSLMEKKGSGKMSGFDELPEVVDSLKDVIHKLETSGLETVTVTAKDGTRLVGHWRQVPNARRTMIAMHGWRASWSRDFGPSADFWKEEGCNVLYAEQRGQGASGGDYMGFGLLERFDCESWIEWVNGTVGEALPVYLAGISMGASTVLMAAGLDLPANVHGILSDCGYTSPHGIWKYVMEKNFHLCYGAYRGAINGACRRKIGVRADDYTTLDAMKVCKIPVLFVHGGSDQFVPVEMTYENYAACAGPKHLLIVPGADHGVSYLVDRLAYEKSVLDFWKLYD